MNYITITKFLNLFDREHTNFETFYKTAHVKTQRDLIPLQQYVLKNNISKDDIRILFENIENKKQYLTKIGRAHV